MATIRKRGGKFQAIVRRGHHSQAKTFSKRADAEHWAKRLEIEIERNVAALPSSTDGITFGELIQSYKKRGHSYQSAIVTRVKAVGCPVCYKNRGKGLNKYRTIHDKRQANLF